MKPLRRLSLSLLALCAALLACAAYGGEPAGGAPPEELRVTLYATQWCGYCAKARDYLGGRGIGYREIDIETDDGRAAFAAVGGTGKGVPLLIDGDRHVRGFSVTTYDAFFAARE